MSVFNQNTTILTAAVSLSDAASAECDSVLRGASSRQAHALATEFATLPVGVPTGSMWDRIDDAFPAWHETLPSTSVAALESARVGALPIMQALSTVTADLGRAERLALADVSAQSLNALGYDVTRADGLGTTAFEARREHEVLLVVVRDGGELTTDHAEVPGDACVDRQHDLMAELQRRGVAIEEGFSVRHDRPSGGSPIAAAARADGTSLARGAVLVGDGTVTTASTLTSSLASPTVARQRRTAGGAR